MEMKNYINGKFENKNKQKIMMQYQNRYYNKLNYNIVQYILIQYCFIYYLQQQQQQLQYTKPKTIQDLFIFYNFVIGIFNLPNTSLNQHNPTLPGSSYYSPNMYPNLNQSQISIIISHIQQQIIQLIQQISNTYKLYGIRFQVQHCQTVLKRMLIPVQIMGYINKKEVIELFQRLPQFLDKSQKKPKDRLQKKTKDSENIKTYNQFEQTRKNDYIVKIRKLIQQKMEKKKYQKESKSEPRSYTQFLLKQNHQRQHQNGILNQFQPIQQQQAKAENDLSWYQNGQRPKRKGNHTVRSRGLQEELCLWVLDEFEKGRLITKKCIMNRARYLGKARNFKGSSRWCQSFLNRNSELREILFMSKCQAKSQQGLIISPYQPTTKFEQRFKINSNKQFQNTQKHQEKDLQNEIFVNSIGHKKNQVNQEQNVKEVEYEKQYEVNSYESNYQAQMNNIKDLGQHIKSAYNLPAQLRKQKQKKTNSYNYTGINKYMNSKGYKKLTQDYYQVQMSEQQLD